MPSKLYGFYASRNILETKRKKKAHGLSFFRNLNFYLEYKTIKRKIIVFCIFDSHGDEALDEKLEIVLNSWDIKTFGCTNYT
jgi:hypothetical protein